MKKILTKAMAFILSLTMFMGILDFMPAVPLMANGSIAMAAEDELVYASQRSYKINTYYNKLKDYKTALAYNQKVWKAQRTDKDALDKNAKDYLKNKDLIALAKKITASGKDDYAKIKAVYDWVAGSIYYDKTAYKSQKASSKISIDLISANPADVYKNKRAISGGYANLTVALLRAIGIPAKPIMGVVSTDSKFGHGWIEAWVIGCNR